MSVAAVKKEKKEGLIYPDLSFKVMGASFNVFNKMGWGNKEIYYQRAFSSELDKSAISYRKEVDCPVLYDGKVVGRYRFDFIIDEKIIVEFKVRPKIGYVHFKQVMSYLRQSEPRLGIIIYFIKEGVRYKRIAN